MPSTSKKQAKFMAAAAHNPAFAKKVGISQDVAKEFNQADKGRKFRSGGMAKMNHEEKGEMKSDLAQDKKMVKKAVGMHDKQLHGGKKTDLAKLKAGGYCGGGKMKAKKYASGGSVRGCGCAVKGKTKGKMV